MKIGEFCAKYNIQHLLGSMGGVCARVCV